MQYFLVKINNAESIKIISLTMVEILVKKCHDIIMRSSIVIQDHKPILSTSQNDYILNEEFLNIFCFKFEKSRLNKTDDAGTFYPVIMTSCWMI